MNRRGLYLGSIGGTTIVAETSFFILIGLFVLIDLQNRMPVPRALLWIPILLLSVLLHELGHAAMIGLFGYGRSNIVLSSFGGVTINRRHARPWHDVVISLAGPVTSFLIWMVSMGILFAVPAASKDPMLSQFLPLLAWANGVWGVFNLLPIFPLDGGQAFRNLITIFTSQRRATIVSIVVSFLVGALLLAWGLWQKQLFLAVVVGMLLMQNYHRWQVYRGTEPPSDETPGT